MRMHLLTAKCTAHVKCQLLESLVLSWTSALLWRTARILLTSGKIWYWFLTIEWVLLGLKKHGRICWVRHEVGKIVEMGLLFVFRWRRFREHSAHLSRSRFNYHPWSPAFPGTVLDVTAFNFILTMTFGAVLFLLYKQGCCVLWQISSMMSLTVHTASNHVFRICLLLIAYKENHG